MSQLPAQMLKHNSVIAMFDEGASLVQLETAIRELHVGSVRCLEDGASAPVHADLAILNPESAKAVARWHESGKHLPTVMMSKDMSFEARLRAVRDGIEGIVAAPVDSQELNEWIKHLSEHRTPQRADILLVDDDPLISEIYAEAMEEIGLNVLIAESAGEAFDLLRSNHIDLMLLDLRMPDIDGVEFARILRQDRNFLSLPIIFLSGERDSDRQLEARRHGGDDFILKPVEPQRLQQIVLLRLERARALQKLIEHDSLTGLLKHSRFHNQLEQEVERSRRTRADICVALIDVDHFKSVNDRYGHPSGDRVLLSLATLFRNMLRKTDLVGRLGGEEFGAVLLDTDTPHAKAVIDRIRTEFEGIEFQSGEQRFHVSFSAGICGFRHDLSAAELVRHADEMLYEAKANGRGRTRVHPAGNSGALRAVAQ